MRNFTWLLFTLLCTGALAAQTPTLLADLNPGDANSSPTRFFSYGDVALFRADGPNDVELYVTDGTPEGTSLLADINPDPGFRGGNSNASDFTLYNGLVYFSAQSPAEGRELWVTDGTTAGTRLVADIQPGDGNGAPFDFIEYNGLLYFTANDGTNGSELWRTDGTADGTELVANINPDGGTSNPNFKFVFNGRLWFTANDGTTGLEVWSTDGTAAGTSLLADINPDGNGAPSRYFVRGGQFFFRADNGVTGSELWASNGTADGTFQVVDLATGEGDSRPDDFFTVGARLYFTADLPDLGRELVFADFAAGSLFLSGVNPAGPDEVDNITEIVPGSAYAFTADTSATPDERDFFLLSDLFGGFTLDNGRDIYGAQDLQELDDLVWTGNSLYFSYENATAGLEIARVALLETDATVELLPELIPGTDDTDIDELTLFNNQLIFEANNGTSGREPFVLDAQTAYVTLTTLDGGTVSNGDTLDFGDIGINIVDSLIVNYRNTGSANSELLSLLFAQDTELSTVAVRGATNNALPAAPDSANLSIIVLPQQPGEFLDTFLTSFTTATGESEILFFVRGNVVVPDVSVTEAGIALNTNDTLDFSGLELGTDSTRTVTVTNNGPAALLILFPEVAIGDAFSTIGDLTRLEAGESTDIPVTYSDDDTTADVDTLIIPTTAGDFRIILTGNYLAPPQPDLTVLLDGTALPSNSTLEFTGVQVDTDSARTLVLENVGQAALTVTGFSFANGSVFSASDVPNEVAPNARNPFTITFAPTEVGTFTDIMTLETNAGMYVVNLNGMSTTSSIVDLGIPATAVYPNPTPGAVRIELKQALTEGSWRVSNLNGQVLRTGAWPASQRIHDVDLGGLAAGTYQVEVLSGAKRLTARVIKR